MSTAQNPVTAEPGNGSATIHARVGDGAIDKVTRLFSAGLADIFTETLQNSRRGGANRVAATIEQDGNIDPRHPHRRRLWDRRSRDPVDLW